MLIPKVLVVYDPRTRRTERTAYAICNRLEIRGLRCDVEALREAGDRSGPLGYLRSALDTAFVRSVPLMPATHNPESYDMVVVGTPIWFGAMTPLVRTFLGANGARLKNVALYLTHSNSLAPGIFDRMEVLAGQPAVARLALGDREFATGSYKATLEPFAARVEQIARRSMANGVRLQRPLSASLH